MKRTFSKRDTTNWSYKMYGTTEIVMDTTPSYRIDKLQDSYNEALLRKAEITMKEKTSDIKNLNLN